jgi:hypothetical protein
MYLSSISYPELTVSVSTFDPNTSTHFSIVPRCKAGEWVTTHTLEALCSHVAGKWPSLPFVFVVENYIDQPDAPEYFPHLHFLTQSSTNEAAEVREYLSTMRTPSLTRSGCVHAEPIKDLQHLSRLPVYWSKYPVPQFFGANLSALRVKDEPDEWTNAEPLPF